MESKKTIKNLAVDVQKEYEKLKKLNPLNIQPFNAGIIYCDNSIHLKNLNNLEGISEKDIHAVYFDPKDIREEFEVYWSTYKGHEIKNGNLEVYLTGGYKRNFELK